MIMSLLLCYCFLVKVFQLVSLNEKGWTGHAHNTFVVNPLLNRSHEIPRSLYKEKINEGTEFTCLSTEFS